MPVGLAVGAIGYGVSAGVSSGASKDAAKKQQEAAIYQAAIARDAFKTGKKNLQPYADIGMAQIAPYQQALNAYQAGIPGYFDQYQNYLNAVNAYNQQGIPAVEAAMMDYQSVLPRYQGAMDQYNASIGRYEDLAKGYAPIMGEYDALKGEYSGAIEDYKKALGRYNESADLYKSKIPEMTRAYDMGQYKESPLYTPMVNNLAELQATPGYQFQLQQGQKALAQSAAARGGSLSGAQQQAMQKFGQQQAATGFQDAWNRAQQAYTKAFEQNMSNKQQLSNTLQANAGLYQAALAPTAESANLIMNKGNIIGAKANTLGQQLGAAATATGMYGTGVNQVGQQAGLYGDAINQAINRAGLYQNAAGMQGQGLGYYGAGMGLLGQNIANRGAAMQFGYGAQNDIENYRKWANTVAQGAAGNYGTAGAQNALTQGNIWGGLAGSLGGMAAGYLGNSGGFGNVFGSTGSSPTWAGGVTNTQNRMGGFADLINSAPRGTYY